MWQRRACENVVRVQTLVRDSLVAASILRVVQLNILDEPNKSTYHGRVDMRDINLTGIDIAPLALADATSQQ